MSEPIKIVGEWRTMETLTPGVWLSRLKGLLDVRDAHSFSHECWANPDCEYFGPIEIVEPEPEPTPLPGCECTAVMLEGGTRFACQSRLTANHDLLLSTYGSTRRQAILCRNAAVAAIVAMEKQT